MFSLQFNRNLSERAQAWLHHYQPRKAQGLFLKLKLFVNRVTNIHSATWQDHQKLLESIAAQCDKQGVTFPKQVLIGSFRNYNAAYIPGTNAYVFDDRVLDPFINISFGDELNEGEILDNIEFTKKDILEPIVAHEVGHHAQRALWFDIVSYGGVFILANYLIKKISDFLNDHNKTDLANTDKRNKTTPAKEPIKPKKTIAQRVGQLLNLKIVRFTLAYIAASFVHSRVRHQMEYDADRRAAKHAGIDATIECLQHLEASQPVMGTQASWVQKIGHTIRQPFSLHPPTEKRITRLERLR